ncbi:MAG TPA: hypothetical protein VFZ06_05690 [Acidimicrobiia bacterium]|nr:hypothetical protein [Acidimicrobiia bacterium]
MQTVAGQSHRSTPNGQSKWRLALLAGAVIALAGAYVILSSGDLFRGQLSPQEIAERYLEARNEYDAKAARALIAPDALLNDVPLIGFHELDAGFEALSIFEISQDPFECMVGDRETWVSCSYQLDSALNDPVGYPPVAGKINFRIADGKIVELQHNFPFGLYSPFVWRPFVDWLMAEHGEASFDRIYRILPSGTATPRLDSEALSYARTAVADYRASVRP